MIFLTLLHLALLVASTSGFQSSPLYHHRSNGMGVKTDSGVATSISKQQQQLQLVGNIITSTFHRSSLRKALVDDLFVEIDNISEKQANGTDQHAKDTTKLSSIIQQLEDADDFHRSSLASEDAKPTKTDNSSLFSPLFGYYNVSYTLTKSAQDNPVGGKWTRSNGWAQKILSTERMLQHILPYNTTGLSVKDPNAVGEAINVITLKALFGYIAINVILRGDAVPMTKILASQTSHSDGREERKRKTKACPLLPITKRAVKAYFDPPRIAIGGAKHGSRNWVNINIGPTSSVVLDTTYIDPRLRIGMGGTSGTRFVFAKCSDDDDGSRAFMPLLKQEPISKIAAASFLFAITASSAWLGLINRYPNRIATWIVRGLSGLVGTAAALFFGLVISSTGGIEDRSDNFEPGK